jgi:hypothetical protein
MRHGFCRKLWIISPKNVPDPLKYSSRIQIQGAKPPDPGSAKLLLIKKLI